MFKSFFPISNLLVEDIFRTCNNYLVVGKNREKILVIFKFPSELIFGWESSKYLTIVLDIHSFIIILYLNTFRSLSQYFIKISWIKGYLFFRNWKKKKRNISWYKENSATWNKQRKTKFRSWWKRCCLEKLKYEVITNARRQT